MSQILGRRFLFVKILGTHERHMQLQEHVTYNRKAFIVRKDIRNINDSRQC